MKLTLKMTMAAALVAASSSAFAILPNNTGVAGEGFAGGVTPDITVTISGASAPDKAVRALFNAVCLPGTQTQFTDQCSTAAGTFANNCDGVAAKFPAASYGAIMCQIDNSANSIPSLSAGIKNVLIRKRSDGGSYWGTAPVAFAVNNNKQMVLSDANCKLTSVANQYVCNRTVTYTGSKAIADMGFSDLPPREFVAPNIATGEAECKTDCTGKLNAASNFALGFGTPVTNALYIRLQKAQGLNTDVNGDAIDDATQKSLFHTGGAAAGFQAQFEANMPSLSKAQLASIFTGKVARWSNVYFQNKPLTDASFGPALADNRVFVCRRVDGSGTQSTTNINLMNVPCTADADKPQADNTSCLSDKGVAAASPVACAGTVANPTTWANPVLPSAAQNLPVIHAASGSGDVDNCLGAIETAGKLGIGIQSLEKNTASYSHIKIDGVSPTLANMASGKYFNWGGVSAQWRNAVVNENNDPMGNPIAAPTADQLAIMNVIRNDAANPSEINTLNNAAKQPFGPAGYLSLTNATIRPFNAALPVMQWTNGGKSCNPMKPRSTTATDFGGI